MIEKILHVDQADHVIEDRREDLEHLAFADQELEGGLISLSAPIRNRQGRVIAAMNISGNAQRNSARQMVKAFLEPLQQAAQNVSDLVARRG